MSNAIPTPKFTFGDGEDGAPNTIKKVAKLEAFVVAYKDGAGKDQIRICFRVPNSDATFVLQQRIGGQNVATNTHEWFNKAFADKLRDMGMEKGASSEPVGSV